jgi:hypothetical protein
MVSLYFPQNSSSAAHVVVIHNHYISKGGESLAITMYLFLLAVF